MAESLDSFGARDTLEVGGKRLTYFRLDRAAAALGADLDRLPFTQRILLENLLRFEDGTSVDRAQIEAVAKWDATAEPDTEIAFRPGRVVLSDVNDVSEILYRTGMRTVGSLYHRSPQNFLKLRAAWRSRPAVDGADAVRQAGADLVLFCLRPRRSSLVADIAGETLLDALRA